MALFTVIIAILFSTVSCQTEKVFVSWTGNFPTEEKKYQSFAMPGSYGYVVDYVEKHPAKKNYTVLVQMKKMPYETGYIGIAWNTELKMKNASMMILTNNPWDNNQWTLGYYHADDNSSPKLLKKEENATISIINGTLQFTFDTNDDVENMYFFYAYADKWGYHSNNKGVSYEPLRKPISSPSIVNVVKKSPIVNSPPIARSVKVFLQSPSIVENINTPKIIKSSAVNNMSGYIVYIVCVIILIML